ncbi:cytochrome P450 [Echria macrotheca]|uniref:Cytochrome P450 n=1 Tax=Echria macrotheca TaxID=438768 RepID=A0AAJ0B4M1_9PEZI|nr:cytochrome P450 [Echria macrotheca]
MAPFTFDTSRATLLQGSAVFAVVGIASHLVYFIRGDHNRFAYRWISRLLASTALLFVVILHFTHYNFIASLIATACFSTSYLTGLYTSISIYRLFFHRLRAFPGPFSARLSNFYHAYIIRRSDNHLVIQKLHQKYGPIVRTGPSNLSVIDPAAIRIVLSNESRCIKSPWYERSLPVVNLHTVRDKKTHDARRKLFSKAFSPGALADYEERVVVHCEEFVRQMRNMAGKPFDAADWFKYFAFDVMGDLGLGKSFNMLTSPTNRWIPTLLETSMADVGPTTPIPWIASILHRLPRAGTHSRAWLEFVGSQVQERIEKHIERPDILSHLIAAYNATNKTPTDYQWLRGDTRLTIVGGSDTTAATLTFLFYYLARDPEQVRKLRSELEPLLGNKTRLDQKDVAKAQHLNGVIHEALRLHPAIPSGFPRLTPPEGITVSGTYIPGDTVVVLPVYAMQRDPANYERPDEFVPERWYSRPEMIRNREAFLTWNIGMNGCIGRALAIMEMRDLLVHWIQNFESVSLAPGEDGSRLLLETKDHFTVGVQPLHLVFHSKK